MRFTSVYWNFVNVTSKMPRSDAAHNKYMTIVMNWFTKAPLVKPPGLRNLKFKIAYTLAPNRNIVNPACGCRRPASKTTPAGRRRSYLL